MKKKSSVSFNSVGTSLLLVVFLAICLVTFAVLSFVTARNDNRMSADLAERRTEYNAACSKAEEAALAVDLGVASGQLPKDLFYKDGTNVTFEYSGKTVSYTIDINDTQKLEVELLLGGSRNYTVTKWKVVN